MDTLDYILKKFEITSWHPRKPTVLHKFSRRSTLPPLFSELGFRVGVEIGVAAGEYSEMLCKANPELKLYSIDPWLEYSIGETVVSQGRLNKYYEMAKARLSPYNCKIIRKCSMEVARYFRDFEDAELDFVYIDGNHEFEHVINDIIQWSKIVRPGGIVAGHDYCKSSKIVCHVMQATQIYTYVYGISPWFVMKGDHQPNWMWVKDKQ